MGLTCVKLRSLLNCCCCKQTPHATHTRQFRVLLLGATSSGKTEIAYMLTGKQRELADLYPTNGVRCYNLEPTSNEAASLLLTEVGGSKDLQRIWPHYYATCHALLFCFDLSGSDMQLQSNFELLQQCLQHGGMRGKPCLLVATRFREGVQLYDVENVFSLETVSRTCGSPLSVCYASPEDLRGGMQWLRRQLNAREPMLAERIRYDVNLQTWKQRRRTLFSSSKLAHVRRMRFKRQHRRLAPLPVISESEQRRPDTAPAAIFYMHVTEEVSIP